MAPGPLHVLPTSSHNPTRSACERGAVATTAVRPHTPEPDSHARPSSGTSSDSFLEDQLEEALRLNEQLRRSQHDQEPTADT